MVELYSVVISDIFKQQTKHQTGERKQIIAQLEELNKRLQNAREMAADKELDPEDFRILKSDCTKRSEALEAKLARLDALYEYGTIKEKREIVGSMYPEKSDI